MSLPLLIIIILIAVLVSGFFLVILFNKINPKISQKKLKEHRKCIIEYFKNEGETPYLIKKNLDGSISNEDFRVVCCADLHLATEEAEFGLTVLGRLIDKTNPDLVILLGDNACAKNFEIEQKLIDLFESKKVYYGFVLGNHDPEALITEELKNKEVTSELYYSTQKKYRVMKFKALMNSPYCIVNLDNIDLFGVGNCSLNIKNSNGVIKTLYFFDSGDYAFGVKRKQKGTEKRSYDHVHDDQLEWYKKEVKLNNSDSIVFLHVPFKEYWYAYKLSLLPFYCFKKEFGNNYEKPCFGDVIDNTFDVFKECNSTKLVLAGHDHKNDSCIEYKGIKLMYSQGLQYDGAYNRRKKNPKLFRWLYKLGCKCYVEGVSVLDLNKDKIDIIPVYAEKENVFYGLEKYYKRAWLEGTYKNELR